MVVASVLMHKLLSLFSKLFSSLLRSALSVDDGRFVSTEPSSSVAASSSDADDRRR